MSMYVNKRPVRETLSSKSMSMIGIPKKFHNKTIEDFYTYGDTSLVKVKKFFKNYIENIDSAFKETNGIFLWGSNGVGKTFLSSLVLKEAYRHRYTSKRTTFVEYMTAYTRTWNTKVLEEKEQYEEVLYNDYKAVEFLVLEEIGKELDTKACIPILEDLLRYREDNGLVTIICTNLKPKVIKEVYGLSVFSLIQGNCTSIKMATPDRRKEVFDEN